MITRQFKEDRLSLLGFGLMRLPTLPDGSIDQAQVTQMVDHAMANGVNYFDTAYPYHAGRSELAIREALVERYPRECFFLATKYPGHQIADSYDPAAIFEEQLQKCGVTYFDYYLLHNVYENSLQVYTDPKWGIVDYFVEQKKKGRIRHLGFSSHARPDTLEKFLRLRGSDMEFCQIQLNWLDWTLQNAREKVELLGRYDLPIWVMEPLRGGKLAALDKEAAAQLKALRPNDPIPAWSFRYLQRLPQVRMILSGMSAMEQMEENVRIFRTEDPLSEKEAEALAQLAEGMKDSLPCTACRYCTAGCPMGLEIPVLIATLNDLRYNLSAGLNAVMHLDALPEDKLPQACISCGKCARICPQGIDIPAAMKELADKVAQLPKWADISRQREEAAKALREQLQ